MKCYTYHGQRALLLKTSTLFISIKYFTNSNIMANRWIFPFERSQPNSEQPLIAKQPVKIDSIHHLLLYTVIVAVKDSTKVILLNRFLLLVFLFSSEFSILSLVSITQLANINEWLQLIQNAAGSTDRVEALLASLYSPAVKSSIYLFLFFIILLT